MTAKEILDEVFDMHEWRMTSPPYNDSEEAVLEAMQEYAKIKCQKLLEIVAEKAKVKNILYYSGRHNIDTSFEFYSELDGKFEVDKDSILKAVDLNEFIE